MNVVVVDGDDALDHADRDLRPIELAALFDVEFEVGVERARRAPGFGDPRNVAPDSLHRLSFGNAVLDAIELVSFDEAGGHPAAVEAAAVVRLLGRPHHVLEGMADLHTLLDQRGHDFEGGHRAHVAVEIPPAPHRIDVGAEEDRLQAGNRARSKG